MKHQRRFLSTIVLVVFCLSLLQNVYFLLPSIAHEQPEPPCAAAQRLVETRAEALRVAERELQRVKDRGYMGSMVESGGIGKNIST